MQIFLLLFSLIFILGCNSGVTPAPITTTTTTTSTSTSTSSTSLTSTSLGTSTSTTSSSTSTTTTTTSTTTTTIGCYIGAYVNGLSNTNSFEALIDKNLAINMWYIDWNTNFPTANCNLVKSYGNAPMIVWEPFINTTNTLEAIDNGNYDVYIAQFAQDAKTWGDLVYLRFGHEMNGNWYPWDGANNGGALGPAKYILAWKHIHDIFTANNATNVKWVWSVNQASWPNEAWNTFDAYYPGTNYVDYIGIDGYNWAQGSWQTFDEIFSTAYNSLNSYNKPLMIAEFSSATDETYSKADWITNAFSEIKSNYPLVKAVIWFNEKKERDWRIQSSANTTTAFKNAVSDSYFSGDKPLN